MDKLTIWPVKLPQIKETIPPEDAPAPAQGDLFYRIATHHIYLGWNIKKYYLLVTDPEEITLAPPSPDAIPLRATVMSSAAEAVEIGPFKSKQAMSDWLKHSRIPLR